jgi:hypothetical protein
MAFRQTIHSSKILTACCSILLLGTLCNFNTSSSQTPPHVAPPSVVNARQASPTSVKVTWTNPSGAFSTISIERSSGPQGLFFEIGQLGANNDRSYVDSDLSAGNTYCYRLRAIAESRIGKTYSEFSKKTCVSTPFDPTAYGVTTGGNEFFVAPDGVPNGTGSIDSPWDLQTALNNPASVQAGDTIWLRGGVYDGLFVSKLRGQTNKPVSVRSFSGEWAKLDGGHDSTKDVLRIEGPNVIFMEMEIMRSKFQRYQNVKGCGRVKGGITIRAANVKVINCVIHDTSLGLGAWGGSPNTEIYGNIVFYNGWIDVPNQNSACDHGIYIQTKKIIKDNIVFRNFRTGITPHGTSAALVDEVTVEGNIIFSNGSMPAGSYRNPGANIWMGYSGGKSTPRVIQKARILENYTYYPRFLPKVASLVLNFSTKGAIVRRNYFIRGFLKREGDHPGGKFNSNVVMADEYDGNWTPASEKINAYYSSRKGDFPFAAFVRPNQYDRNKAHIVIYNFGGSNSAKVDISNLNWERGTTYELRNVQDYFNDVLSGTYSGNGEITIPMTNHTVAAPVGWPVTPTTFPEFGAFVLVKTKQ